MKQTIQLGVLSALNIGIAFVFQWYVFTQLGPGIETDALFAGMTLPQLVLVVISGSLMHVLVPLLAGEDNNALLRKSWGFLYLVAGLFGLLGIILYLTAQWWVALSLPGFSDLGLSLTVKLTRIQLVGMVFSAVNCVQWATYHARQKFLRAEFTPLIGSIVALLILVWALPYFGVVAAAWINVFRMGLQTLLLAPGMGKPVRPDLKNPAISAAWQRIKPLLVGSVYYKTDPLMDRFLLSMTSSGSISLYYLAMQIYGAFNQVINKAIAAPLVPILSKLHKADDISKFESTYRMKILQIGVISISCYLLICIFGQYLLIFVIGYGNVSADNVENLWMIMIWLGGMFVGGAVGQISSSSFYSTGDTRTPARIGVITYTLYVPLKILLFYIYGVYGLALVTSLFVMVNFFFQIYCLNKKHAKYR